MILTLAHTVVYLHRSSVTVYKSRHKPAHLNFPQETVRYLDIKDQPGFEGKLNDFLNKCDIKGKKVIIVAAGDITFKKLIKLEEDESADMEEAFADFRSKLPFGPEYRQAMMVELKQRLILWSLPQPFVSVVISAVEESGAKVRGVVPVAAYGVKESGGKLNADSVSKILSEKRPLKYMNFLEAQ